MPSTTSRREPVYLLAYLRPRAAAGVETFDPDRYVRSVQFDDAVGVVAVENDPRADRLVVRFSTPFVPHAAEVERRVRRLFDLDADLPQVHRVLGRDPSLVPLLAHSPGVRIPGSWCPFELLVRTIVGQQVSVKGATTVMGRIAARCGREYQSGYGPTWAFPTPRMVAESDLSAVGMPGQRVRALQSIAAAVATGELSVEANLPAAAVKAALIRQPGIGPWTAEYFALRGLRDGDAWPASDLVLRRAVDERAAGSTPDPNYADRWKPFRGYAAMHLWNQATRAARKNPRQEMS
ncbi:DNA-3-methyladenine glycosylase 2 family protein [bacterium]|nr:DNA-3-methyladenine glycosylase 2 family protein [bacterium]